MLITNPVYEQWEEIEKKYDGYCVFLANCIGNVTQPEGGEAWAYNKSLADLTGEVMHFIDSDEHSLGMYTFITLTDFGDTVSVTHVVTLDD